MSLVISNYILEKIEMLEEQLQIEIAVMLFQQERFTLAQAACFAQMNQLAFQKLLAELQIPYSLFPDFCKKSKHELENILDTNHTKALQHFPEI